MRSVIGTIILAFVFGVGAWAILVLSGPQDRTAGPKADRRAQRGDPVASAGGSFDPAFVSAANWPIFRGRQSLAGVADGALGDSLRLYWRFETGGPIVSSAVIGGGRVFVGSDDGNLYALGLSDGRKLWSFPTGDAIEAPPLLLDGVVFVGSTDSFLYAVDAETGRLKWKYRTGARITGSANWARAGDGRTRILVGSYDNNLHCVDAATGQAVWTHEADNYINGAPAVAGGLAVFGGCDATIHVVRIADGKADAAIEVGSYIPGSPALAGKYAYVGHYAGELLCADLAAGRIVWRYECGECPILSSAAVGRSRVVFGARDERVHCVDRLSGERIWVFRAAGDVDSSPVICGDKVVAASGDGRLYLLRLADGAELWSRQVGGPITASPAVAPPVVIVGSEDGCVRAFGPKQ